MTPSSTPGSHTPDDPMPWSDTDPHGGVDATRPIPPVSRLSGAHPAPRDDDGPGADRRDGAPAEAGAGGGDEDWSWYDDEADQHTRPLPAVSAQRHPDTERHEQEPAPRTEPAPAVRQPPAGGHGGPGPHEQDGLPGHAGQPGASGQPGAAGVHPEDPAVRHARQRAEFGGMQLVPGFFGWLSALALTWLLLALAGLVGAALSLELGDGVGGVVDDLASGSPAAWTAAAVLGVVELLAFLGGGYAAGRMARFSGARQGVSVWLWSVFGRAVATVAGLVWADTVGLAPVGVSVQSLIGDLLAPGLLAVAVVLVVDLVGAVLGGLWGTRYHRRVDRWA